MFYVYSGLRRTGKSYSATLLAKQFLSLVNMFGLIILWILEKLFPDFLHDNCKRADEIDDIVLCGMAFLLLTRLIGNLAPGVGCI